MYKSVFKRTIDFAIALILLLLFSPILIILTLILTIDFKGNPFFIQSRPGKKDKSFNIIKFKTMDEKRDLSGNLLPDKERLTKMGSFIRKTSLDELPQLVNVLIGDMSLIGPRPLLKQYLPFYTKRERIRHNVRPGITGLAQTSGRNNLNWDERLELDAFYVENLSLKLDIKLLIRTIKNVISRKDVLVIPGEKFTTLDKHRSND
ncbi:MAG: sugar transferase [Cyclobacteriaceae bacterium]